MHEAIRKRKRFGNADMFVWLGMFLVVTGVAVVSANAQSTALESMPPRYLASISVNNNPAPAAILWGESGDGLVVGIASLRTTVFSPVWPVVDAYIANHGSTPIGWNGTTAALFKLQLDGNIYSSGDFGGHGSALAAGEQSELLTVDSMSFHKVEKLAAYDSVDDNAPRPVLSTSSHSIRLYFNWGGRFVASPLVTFTVRLQPYPVADGVLQIEKDLKSGNTFVRSIAATRAGQLRLAGARAAVTEAVRDKDDGVRNSAIRALRFIGDRSTVPTLKPALNDKSYDVRVSAIESLVSLGEVFNVAWADPIIRSKQGNAFDNAIWLVRRYGGDASVATLIRCLDMKDPSVGNYYNYTLVWQIEACGGPRLTYYFDFDGIGTRNQVESNRRVLAEMQDWLRKREQFKK